MSNNELKPKKYHISVLAISLTPYLLHFNVDHFSIGEGFVILTDTKHNTQKWFPVERCMIEEVHQEE